MLSRVGDRLVRVDCRFPGTRLIVEVMGYRWHRTVDQMARDAARFNALVLDGFLPLQFTHAQVTLDADWVLAQVTAALTHVAA